jgi:hypothetical protein
MGLIGLFYPWGFILQAVAILHFVRRRPDTYWLWIILVGGGLGALVYIAAEVVPKGERAAQATSGLAGNPGRVLSVKCVPRCRA